MAMAYLLELEHVSKGYGRGLRKSSVLCDVSLVVELGELVTAWGTRRSGRTTLMRVAAGILPPDSGVVRFAGEDLARRRGDVLGSGIGYCHNSFLPADGRLVLEAMPDEHLDFLAMDAFSSDAVPVHLLAAEAYRTYLRHLNPNGVLAINISNRYLNLAPVVAEAALANGFSGIIVEDDGCGMTEEVRARIFDPFFTTKPDGTGIGLPLAKKFVERNGGKIAISNGISGGAKFDVMFPAGEPN